MSGWLKAGLIGAVVLLIFNLVGLIPNTFLACLTALLTILTYLVCGALAAHWMPPVRNAGAAAGQGALAGLLASFIGGITKIIIGVIKPASIGLAPTVSQLPPDSINSLRQAGIQPEMIFGTGGAAVVGSLCCAAGIVFALALGAIGGAIYAAIKPE